MIELEDIAPGFAFVRDEGLVPAEGELDTQAFGNAFLAMRGPAFSLRFVRDRGQLFVDVARDATRWHGLEAALAFVDATLSPEEFGRPPDPWALAQALRQRWAQVAALFADAQRLAEFEDEARVRAEQVRRRIFGPPP
jgi:hypothetical protein